MRNLSIAEMENMLPKSVKKQYRTFLMRDQSLPAPKEGYYIINLDSEDNQGTHWCLTQITPKNEPNLYFDPFGFLSFLQLRLLVF